MLGCLSNLQILASLSSFWWSTRQSENSFTRLRHTSSQDTQAKWLLESEVNAKKIHYKKIKLQVISLFIFTNSLFDYILVYKVSKWRSDRFSSRLLRRSYETRKWLSYIHLWQEPEGQTCPRCPFNPWFQIQGMSEEEGDMRWEEKTRRR